MKTKIIDILNMIARGETPPKKIMYKGTIWEYKENEKDYSSVEWNEWLFDVYLITEILNDYIEILETTITYNQAVDTLFDNICKTPGLNLIDNTKNINITPKKIEKLDYKLRNLENPTYNENWLMCCIEANANKINEIINKINMEV